MCMCKKQWFQLGILFSDRIQLMPEQHTRTCQKSINNGFFVKFFNFQWKVLLICVDWVTFSFAVFKFDLFYWCWFFTLEEMNIGLVWRYDENSRKVVKKMVSTKRSRTKKHWDICAKILRVKIKKSKLNENHLNWRVPLKLIQVPDWIMYIESRLKYFIKCVCCTHVKVWDRNN